MHTGNDGAFVGKKISVAHLKRVTAGIIAEISQPWCNYSIMKPSMVKVKLSLYLTKYHTMKT
jgi:hypothetical protein